jgi:hypothetical protein
MTWADRGMALCLTLVRIIGSHAVNLSDLLKEYVLWWGEPRDGRTATFATLAKAQHAKKGAKAETGLDGTHDRGRSQAPDPGNGGMKPKQKKNKNTQKRGHKFNNQLFTFVCFQIRALVLCPYQQAHASALR